MKRLWAFYIAIGYTLIVPTISAFFLGTQTGVTLGVLGFAVILATRIEDIEVFKLWGMEAKLKQRIDEANNILQRLYLLAANLASIAIMSAHKSEGFAVTHEAGVKRKDQTLRYAYDTIQILDLECQTIREALEIDYLGTCSDYLTFLEHTVKGTLPSDIRSMFIEQIKPRREFPSIADLPHPHKIRETLGEMNLINEKTTLIVDDYEYYFQNQKHRDPLRWSNRTHW